MLEQELDWARVLLVTADGKTGRLELIAVSFGDDWLVELGGIRVVEELTVDSIVELVTGTIMWDCGCGCGGGTGTGTGGWLGSRIIVVGCGLACTVNCCCEGFWIWPRKVHACKG